MAVICVSAQTKHTDRMWLCLRCHMKNPPPGNTHTHTHSRVRGQAHETQHTHYMPIHVWVASKLWCLCVIRGMLSPYSLTLARKHTLLMPVSYLLEAPGTLRPPAQALRARGDTSGPANVVTCAKVGRRGECVEGEKQTGRNEG